jgi:outer membrane protein assembly factor BamD (BamD/ComL family)
MTRENFYILLGLNLEPPETDHDVIENTIKQKQHEWSRLRNHPTKGIQAKQYIGLIPEIRRVMLDSKLRETEANEAQNISRMKKTEKFSGLDRHINIQLSKGYITDQEIQKLAAFHKVAEATIQERIRLKEEEKFAEIDKHIEMRLSKGFITEEEISRLAKLHGVEREKIRKRVKGPIEKEHKKLSETKTLDKAIEKVIRDNLKIIGKSTLYDFLNIPSSSDLETLQKRTKEKEAELSKIRRKDATATASGVLVGQCFTLFKSEDNRIAYDSTLAQVHLSELNADIDMAGLDGRIRKEYADILINRAMQLGMDREEAAGYIEGYCRKKGWRFEIAEKRGLSPKSIMKIAALIVLVLIGAYLTNDMIREDRDKQEYLAVLNTVSQKIELQEKERLFQDYLLSHEKDSKYSKKAEKKLVEIQRQLHEIQYQQVIDQSNTMVNQSELAQAGQILKKFLEDHPKSEFADKVNEKLAELSKIMEQNDFQTLISKSGLSTREKIDSYQDYLKRYPKGNHRKEVSDMLKVLGDTYHAEVKANLVECENRRAWQDCIEHAQSFMQNYPEDPRSKELEQLLENYQKNHRNALAVDQVIRIAQTKEDDFMAAKKIYLAYLDSNPEPFFRQKIETELQKLETAEKDAERHQMLEEKRKLIAGSGSRFRLNSGDTVTDSRTGLTWTLAGLGNPGQECMDYESAVTFVKALTAGGFKDWRLPSESELARLYKESPYFPVSDAKWYWSSESFKSYSDAWIHRVKVVTSQKESNWKSEYMDSRECGGVRAVRP